jgi:RNA polymerase sigma-70 factor (ECF subfamily)
MSGPSQNLQTTDSGAGRFPPTLWSVVLRAGESNGAKAQEALATLCQSYWYPLYAYLRRHGESPHDAEDLTQDFFLHLLEKQRLGQVQREKGKFRSFLLASLQNFLSDQWDKSRAQKRGGGASLLSLDAARAEERYQLEPADTLDPQKIFERRWALTVLERVLARLEVEYAEAGKQERFAQLQHLLLQEGDSGSYAEVGRQLGMSEGAVKMAVLRLRQRSRELFRAEIAHTVGSEDEIEDEVRHLFAAIAG